MVNYSNTACQSKYGTLILLFERLYILLFYKLEFIPLFHAVSH